MHDFSCNNVTDDPIKICVTLQDRHEREPAGSQSHENFVTLKIPGQLNEVVPLTPVQIYIKEEQFVQDQLDVVPLSPVQIFLREEETAYSKTEEPELVSLVPVLPKEEHVVDEVPEDFEEGSGRLIINLENSSSEDWSNQSDPRAVEQNVAHASYVEYVETSEPILMELGSASTEGSSHPLRVTPDSEGTVGNRELYELMGSSEVVPISENGDTFPDGYTDGECAELMGESRVPAEAFHCGFCGEGFRNEGEMQMHTLSHSVRRTAWREVQEVKLKPKPVRTLKAQHTCGDCSETFERLEHLMRHRLGHIRAALGKPFGGLKLSGSPKPLGAPKQSGVPELKVSTTPDSRRTAVAVSARTSPKKSSQRAATASQPKRWSRRKKARRRRVS